MTNNKLQVLCFYAVTICIVIHNIKCATQNKCRVEIYKTNCILKDLNDNQKEQLVNRLIQTYKYEQLQVQIFPPVTALLTSRVKARAFDSIITHERNIQELLSVIIGREPTNDLSNPDDYDTAVNNRHSVVRRIFNYVLHQRMNRIQMCKNGESTKCKLLGIITRTLNPGSRYKQKCNEDLNCVITLEGQFTTSGVLPTYENEVSEYIDWVLEPGVYKTDVDMD